MKFKRQFTIFLCGLLLGFSALISSLMLCMMLLIGMGVSTAFYSSLLASSIILSFFIFPIIRYPVPTGPFVVGTCFYTWYDIARKEMRSKQNLRELTVHIWVPTNVTQKQRSLFYFLDFITALRVYFKPRKPLAISPEHETYPLIIFSHGLKSLSSFHCALLQDLASHGYIVVAINHTYGCFAPYFDPALGLAFEQTSQANLDSYLERLEEEIELWVADIQFVITQLSELNISSSPFTSRINLQAIGVYGHSLGGAAAAEACRRDNRIKAGISLDSSLMKKTTNGFFKPYMFIRGSLLDNTNEQIAASLGHIYSKALQRYRNHLLEFCTILGPYGYCITLDEVGHYAFTDASLLCPLARLCLNFCTKSKHTPAVIALTTNYAQAFFDTYLKQRDTFLSHLSFNGKFYSHKVTQITKQL